MGAVSAVAEGNLWFALLSDLSAWTWHFLRDAPFRPREETVTETLLTEFSRQGAGQVWIRKSSISEENTLGLDWAWAINTDAGWVVSLVQAKNISGRRFGFYRELRRPDASKQAQNLLHAAALAEALPLFVFYNNELPPFKQAGNEVAFGGCDRSTLLRDSRNIHGNQLPWQNGYSPLGISVAHAQDVRDHAVPPPARNQWAATVNGFAMPWECLLCPAWVARPPSQSPREAEEFALDEEGGASADSSGISKTVRELAYAISNVRDQADARLAAGRRSPVWIHPEEPTWSRLLREGIDPANDSDMPPVEYFIVTDARG